MSGKVFALALVVVSFSKAGWAAAPLDEALTLQQSGRLVDAADAFARARKADPQSALAARGACELALVLEVGDPKRDSREPCHRALVLGGQAEDMRNEAASMLAARRRVTLDDLAMASLLADGIVRKDPTEPWGYVARCDVARRIGSADVLATCLRDLARIAPRHAATLRELARPTEPVPAWVWLARVAFGLVLLGTLAHAARRRVARAGAAARPVLAVFVFAVAALAPGAAAADEAEAMTPPQRQLGPSGDLSRFKIDDANPEASVPTPEARAKGPLQFGYFIQDLTVRAESATKRGDHAAAARYYAALAKAAPDVALPPRKLCESLEAAGDVASAIKACRSAVTRGGSQVGDFTRFVGLVLAQPDPLPAGEKAELDAVLSHLAGNASVGAQLAVLRCEVALRFHDAAALEACTAELEKTAPQDPKTVSFAWALAMDRRDAAGAREAIDRARSLGMPKDGVATMERATSRMSRIRVVRIALLFVGVVALMLAAVRALRRAAERRRVAA